MKIELDDESKRLLVEYLSCDLPELTLIEASAIEVEKSSSNVDLTRSLEENGFDKDLTMDDIKLMHHRASKLLIAFNAVINAFTESNAE